MADVVFEAPPATDIEADVVIVGAGACGLTAALAAREAGREVLVLERDSSPSGSTSMSSGFVPAPGTRFQAAIGVDDDDAERFIEDIMAKSHGTSDARLARLAASTIAEAVEWLSESANCDWHVLDDFLYPGHSRHRMHAVSEKTGAAMEARLLAAAIAADIAPVTGATVDRLYAEGRRIRAVGAVRPDGQTEIIGCDRLILACNGYGGNRAMVERFIPEISGGLYYSHQGNTGHAIAWGETLGAQLQHLSGYQGHASVAQPHNVLISWALMMEGGVQVNSDGRRFAAENEGYSEQATRVLAQPGGVAWNVYDEKRHRFAMEGFPDYREAAAAGAIRSGEDVAALAAATGLSADALAETITEVADLARSGGLDGFGRDFTGIAPLEPPFHAVKVTGALFHTQGGLVIGDDARVLHRDGTPFDNLYAGGGAACGVSGPAVDGYLSGNGLLTAIAFGYLAGRNAAAL